MAQFVLIAVLIIFASSTYVYASDGHNGILFKMTQKQVEKKGFVCNPIKNKSDTDIADCRHMNMTGNAFGYPTKDYRVIIGPSKKVDMIVAKFSGRITTDQYYDLQYKIEHFFPNKNEAATVNDDVFMGDEWRSNNNAAARLSLFPGSSSSMYITFVSPRAVLAKDKKQMKDMEKKNDTDGEAEK